MFQLLGLKAALECLLDFSGCCEKIGRQLALSHEVEPHSNAEIIKNHPMRDK